jgi:hypothetical protein
MGGFIGKAWIDRLFMGRENPKVTIEESIRSPEIAEARMRNLREFASTFELEIGEKPEYEYDEKGIVRAASYDAVIDSMLQVLNSMHRRV